jgi:hypothetical protein
LIDGVFVPGGGDRPCQLDSAGHTFAGFPKTDGGLVGVIWARAANVTCDRPDQKSWFWIYAMGPGGEYMPHRRGLLMLHANAGITFDLERMRAIHSGAAPVRFSATAGAPRNGLVDVWVFVDGQLKFSRTKLQKEDGAIAIGIPFVPGDRFLTLVSTDGGNGTDYDHLVLGDPVIHVNNAGMDVR